MSTGPKKGSSNIYTLIDPRTEAIRYVGITKHSIAHRLSRHLEEAKRGSMYPVHRWIRSLMSQGMVPRVDLLEQTANWEQEIYWIAFCRANGHPLLNCTDGGEGLFNPSIDVRRKIGEAHRGKIVSPEVREKLSLAHRGQKLLPDHRERIRQSLLVQPPRSADWCRRISAGKMGHEVSETTRLKLSLALKGRKMPPRTPEHCAKLSAVQKGKDVSAETRAKMSAALKGRKLPPRSDEHRRKLSEANKGQPGNRGAAKVTPADVQAIRRRYAEGGITYKELASQYAHTGITWRGIGRIIRGESWDDLEPPHITASVG